MSRDPLKAAPFVALYPALVLRAKELGYALAVHGSVIRDFDLVAIPWVEEAVPAEELAEAIKNIVNGWWSSGFDEGGKSRNPTDNPHGRKSWAIMLGGPSEHVSAIPYIDLCVMPRI